MSARLLVPAALLCGLLVHPVAAGPEPSAAQPRLVAATYQVADLVIPVNDAGQNKPTEEEKLIKLITCTIQPRSWSDMGGPGTIDYYPLTTALVVNQTPEIQEQIADLLAALRRQQDAQVVLEVRLLSVPVATFGRLVKEYNLNPSLTVLDDAQMAKLIEAMQADPSACIMQAPKITTMNGRNASFAVADNQAYVTDVTLDNRDGQDLYRPKTEKITTGLQLAMRPTISADRREVLVSLKMKQSELGSPVVPLFPIVMPVKQAEGGEPVVFTQYRQQPTLTTHAMQRALTIPDGRTAVLSGWVQMHNEASSLATPVLSDIPFLKELFTTVHYTTEVNQVLVAVTPRILVAQEQEERKAPPVLPCPKAKAAVCAPPAVIRCGFTGQPCMKSPVAELLAKYHDACRGGRLTEATQFAVQALAIDPACFSKECCEKNR